MIIFDCEESIGIFISHITVRAQPPASFTFIGNNVYMINSFNWLVSG